MHTHDRALDIYRRLRTEHAENALSRTDAADQFIEMAGYLEPEFVRRLAVSDLGRLLDDKKSDSARYRALTSPGLAEV